MRVNPVSVSSNRILEEVGILSDTSREVNICFLDGVRVIYWATVPNMWNPLLALILQICFVSHSTDRASFLFLGMKEVLYLCS